MVNTLARDAGVKFGPLLLETLVKHYFDRFLKDNVSLDKGTTKLRQDELLYDQAFIIVKTFLEAASKHTVEELQKFSNTRTPSPLWVHVVKVLVPTSCCDEAAKIVIQALGGEEMTKKLVGGTKWWQVRGVKGVDAEWIAAKKDWQEAKRRYEAREKNGKTEQGHARSTTESSSLPGVREDASPHYQPEMDEMRCILYTHGGGYYFGSVDQERYAIQRFARKINGRVFAINYRLAPQYPFPCALQDIIAAYLFLIRPPEGASHLPVNPAHLIVAGDSAGGGLTIALMQVLRDCGLPLPAGAVLISPWCDLTHSFPSIHTNTATDVVPPYGLSFAKPSTLWPPPPDELTAEVREKLHTRIRQAVFSKPKDRAKSPVTPDSGGFDVRLPQTGRTLHLGSTASLPTLAAGVRDQTVTCVTASGERLSIHEQIHLYTPNYMLTHPLISPVVSYLGGLPPMFVIAGDAEVLRDEIIYMAHKAAHPERYPISQAARDMYPALNGIEERFGPAKVHLQVYDDAAHILPILFSFTTPAKYCFRAIATFIRYTTGILPTSASDTIGDIPVTVSPAGSPSLEPTVADSVPSIDETRLSRPPSNSRAHSSPASREVSPRPRGASLFTNGSRKMAEDADGVSRTKSLRRALSTHASRAGVLFRGQSLSGRNSRRESPARGSTAPPLPPLPPSPLPPSRGSTSGQATPERKSTDDVAGPRFYGSGHKHDEDAVRRAGEPAVYQNGLDAMIRERVSTHGVIRPLEPESDLSAFSLPPELIGVVSELALRRYQDAKAKFDKKFARTYKTIEKHRRKHLDIAHRDALRTMTQLQNYFSQNGGGEAHDTVNGIGEGLKASGSWSWAWALDMDERPPPSSIVARRDTHEAVELARIADQSVLAEEGMMSGNNLWSLMVNFLTTTPDKKDHGHHHDHNTDDSGNTQSESRESKRERIRSRFAQLVSDHKKRKGQPGTAPAKE